MQAHSQSIWWPRIATFGLAALAAGSVLFWGLRLQQPSHAPGAAPATAPAPAQADPQSIARLLGAGQAPVAVLAPSAASRYALAGVVAGQRGGAALISVDGKTARPYRVGSRVDDGLVLQSVSGRRAALAASAAGPAAFTLEMAPLKK